MKFYVNITHFDILLNLANIDITLNYIRYIFFNKMWSFQKK